VGQDSNPDAIDPRVTIGIVTHSPAPTTAEVAVSRVLRMGIWGGRHSWRLGPPRRPAPVDLLLVLGVVGLILGIRGLAHEAAGPLREPVVLDLSPAALPAYTFFSLARGASAYVLSLAFTLAYGWWAAKDAVAGRVLVPLLDILQSIPVLSFLPGVVLALVMLFPSTRLGLELAAVVMIFTAQAWNMTFSFYHSVRAVPPEQREAATVFRFSPGQLFRWVELPSAAMGLVWNSMMSVAGGWVFLMINESFRVDADHDYRLPGVGSYMSQALAEGRTDAVVWALLAMAVMIVGLDQFIWRPVVVWAQKFRVEEGGEAPEATSWFLTWLRRSRLLVVVRILTRRLRRLAAVRLPQRPPHKPRAAALSVERPRWARWLSASLLGVLLLALAVGGVALVRLLRGVGAEGWLELLGDAGLTLGRVALAVGLSTLWTVPAGLAIGLSPRLSRFLQPLVQLVASFPAPLVFPLVTIGLDRIGVTLGWGSVLLMLLGTQWYILFNVIAGATAVPADLREAARSYRITRWQRFRVLYGPALFPYLVTGWVTAAGGAWNLSIVAEYDVTGVSHVDPARGLGADISDAFAASDWPRLAAATLVMSVLVVLLNRTLWQRLYRLAEERYALSK
jgi:NitT/TauT family transport system permease protein